MSFAQRIASSKAVSTSSRVMPFRSTYRSTRCVKARGLEKAEKAMFGEDFGARDPFAAELESNFGEKVLGNYNTDHIIKPPDAIGKVIGLASRACADSEAALLDESTRERLRQQVPGWRVVGAGGGGSSADLLIQQEWSVKDADAAKTLVDSILQLAASEGHQPLKVEAVGGTTVVAQLQTTALGGLTEADFILAAKANSLDISTLLAKRKQRFWA